MIEDWREIRTCGTYRFTSRILVSFFLEYRTILASGISNIATLFEMKSSVKFNITTLRGIWTLRYAIFVGEEFEVNISEDHSFNVSDTALKFNNTIGETEQRIFYFENFSLINFRWNENSKWNWMWRITSHFTYDLVSNFYEEYRGNGLNLALYLKKRRRKKLTFLIIGWKIPFI